MANELKGLPGHSADYFGDTRDHWWNADQLEMITRRWSAAQITEVLDVGCGVGHWGRALAPHLPSSTRLVGTDRDAGWVEKAAERAAQTGLGERFSYRVATAERQPFADASFDLVTCQTLLMHVRDPRQVLSEMVRVTRPGGLVVAAEPTNVAGPLLDSIACGDPPELTTALMGFYLTCQRGIRELGLGDHQLGESLPRLFRAAGLEAFEMRQCDRPWTLLPPYASPFEQAQVEDEHDSAQRELAPWDQATTRRYFLAGGGSVDAFPSSWSAALQQRQRISDGLRAGTFSRASGGLSYLAWGRRPSSRRS